MFKLTVLLIFTVLLASCNSRTDNNENSGNKTEELLLSQELNNEELHKLINSLLEEGVGKENIVVLQTKDVGKLENLLITESGDTIKDDNLPAPIWDFRFNKEVFKNIVKKGYLNSEEADFIFEEMTPNRTILMDSSQLIRKGITNGKLDSIFPTNSKLEGYRKLEEETGTTGFIVISTPLLGKNKKKAFIATNSYGLGKHISRTHYLLENKSGKWQVVYKDFDTV